VYARILVPLEGSKLAERALPAAEELARLMSAALHLLRVVDPTQLDLAGYGTYESALAQTASSPFLTDEGAAAHAYLERMTARDIERGLGTSHEVRYGVAAREIVAMAQPGDLIVMGTHDRGGLARWFLGSVAEAVVRRAPVPVLVVPVHADGRHEQDPAVASSPTPRGTGAQPRLRQAIPYHGA
jgi:nucleotide-binding universal stress UspA family protein